MPFVPESKTAFLKDLNEKKIPYKVKNWTNYMGNVKKPQAIVIQVNEKSQVQTVLKAVKKQNQDYPQQKITVRATAGWEDDQSIWCCFPWAKAQEERYNESFSFSQGSAADVIIRFGKKYQRVEKIGPLQQKEPLKSKNPLDHLPTYEIRVTSGIQIAVLAETLRKMGLSLRTASMLSWASAVGLAGTGGHGTGRDEPAFSGQITSMEICDENGEIREIKAEDKDFATLCSAHCGALGIILSMNLKVVEAFNLKETIYNFTNAKSMAPHLADLLKNNQYFSLIGIPSYGSAHSNESLISKWQIRCWNYTEEGPSKVQEAPYTADTRSLAQELSVRAGDSLQEFLLDSKLKKLFPLYLLLSAAIITATRGTDALIDHENSITHYQVSFPKAMRDVSYLLPVRDEQAGELLAAVMQKIDDLIKIAASRGEYPVTYAAYARYIKGTTGGLSTTATQFEDEHILALDIVTHPEAPGIANFERSLLEYFSEIYIKPRFHLGKIFPEGIQSYADFLSPEAISEYKKALMRWYGDETKLKTSPFITPYFESMLEPQLLQKEISLKLPEIPLVHSTGSHSDEDCSRFLEQLILALQIVPLKDKVANELKESFIVECQEILSTMKHSKEEQKNSECVLI